MTAPSPAYVYRCTLDRIVDGDTLWVVVDLGLRASHGIEIRLIGIDTPEVVGATRDEGLQARDALAWLLRDKALTIQTHLDKRNRERADGWKRWLADLWADDLHVQTWLVENGFAVWWVPS